MDKFPFFEINSHMSDFAGLAIVEENEIPFVQILLMDVFAVVLVDFG